MEYELGSRYNLEYLDGLKVEANQLFSKGELAQSSKLYYRILKESFSLTNSNLELEELKNHAKLLYNRVPNAELTKFLSTISCNLAICQNRMKNTQDAKVYFEISVILDVNNYKANYHLAHSHLSLNDYNSSLHYIQNCQKIVNSDLKSWKNKNQPHLDLMDQVRMALKRSDQTKEYVTDPNQLVKDICEGLNVNLNLQRLQLVSSKSLVQSEAISSLVQLCQKKLDEGVVDDVLVSIWSCLYHILYKCEDECKYILYSQFLSNFNTKEKSLCLYVKQLLKYEPLIRNDANSVNSVSDVNDSKNVNQVDVVSVVTNVAKCCPLVKGVDSLEVLVLLLDEDKVDSEVILSSLLVYFSKVDKNSQKEQNGSFNITLKKLLEKLFSMCDEDFVKNEEQLSACLMAIFRMEFGFFEVSMDTFSNMFNMSLEPYTKTDFDSFTGKPIVSFEYNWFVVVKSLFLANKTLFKNYLVVNQVTQHLLKQLFNCDSNKTKKDCIEVLVNCLDFVEFRQEVLDYVQDHESFMELMNSPDLVNFVNLLSENFKNSSRSSDKSTNRTDLPNVQLLTNNFNTGDKSTYSRSYDNRSSDYGHKCVYNELSYWFVQTKVLMFSKLSLHSPQVKGEVLNYFDLFGLLPKMVYYNYQNKFDQELVLQCISFVSLHEEFKKSDLSFLSLFTQDYKHSECSSLLFTQIIANLLRGNKDRNSFVEDLDLAKYDSEQLNQLKVLQDNLPPEAKITVNGNYFEGNNESANISRSVIFDLYDYSVPKYLCKTFKCVNSEITKSLIIESLHYLSLNVNHRRYLQSFGVMRILINVANSSKYQNKHNIQAQSYRSLTKYKLIVQSIAHLIIATNPSNLTFNDAHDSIQPLMNLLDDNNELYQYESALALTNLLSINDDVRKRVFILKGWDKFSNLLFSDNEMLKTAGLEGWCNLCGGDDIVHGHFYLQIKTQIENSSADKVYDINVHDINIMLMFISPSVRVESLSAASGAVALLVRDSRIAQYMPFISRFDNVMKTLNEIDDTSIIHRLLTILSCVIQSKLPNLSEPNQNKVDQVFQNIRATVKKNYNKYINKTLLDLYNEIC